MTRAEADEYMMRYFEKTIKENDEHATRLEHLYPVITDKSQAEFMKTEAKFLREHTKRLRDAIKNWPRG
jgi:hypothetical protein